jgi:hypothetical protein
VLSRAEELTPFEPDERFPWLHELAGSTAVARTSTSLTWLASVHLHSRRIPADVLERLPMEGIEVTTRDGSAWETNVIPHELHRLFEGETFLWGGDLNCDPRMDGFGGDYAGGNRRVFEIWRGPAQSTHARPFTKTSSRRFSVQARESRSNLITSSSILRPSNACRRGRSTRLQPKFRTR